MFIFKTSFSGEDIRRITEKLSLQVDAKSPLSARSREIIQSVQFSSHDLRKAATAAGIKIASELAYGKNNAHF